MIQESYYGRRIRAVWQIWLWSAILALLCTMITYPGIWYSDSYVRVETGKAVLNRIVKTLIGQRARLDTGNAFTIIPSFFMALSLGITGHVVLYTFTQAFAFFAATFLLIRELNEENRKLQYVLFACCPLIYGMSVYYEAGIGCAVGMAGLILLLRRTGEPRSRGARVLEFLLVVFFSFVTTGYRTNALTILPVLAFYLFRMKTEKIRKAMMLAALMIGILLTKAVPWVFDIHSDSVTSAGFIWEMLTAIQRMSPEEQEKYQDYLDDIGGEGSTLGALAESNEITAESFLWGTNLGISQMSRPGATAKAVMKYFRLMIEKPREWFSVRWEMLLRALGVTERLGNSEYNYDRWDRMREYGMIDSPQRRAFHTSYMKACTALGEFILRPWVLFLLSFLLSAVEFFRNHETREKNSFVLGIAFFYYLAYLLDIPYFEFRYYYPSLYLMLILDVSILISWGSAVLKQGRKYPNEWRGRNIIHQEKN